MDQAAHETRADLYRLQTQQNDLKQHADKIIQGVKKIGPKQAKRAVWELFQNAVDLSPSCEISISITESELIFSHNGVPFTMHTLDCLFTQVSSKTLSEKKIERKEVDPIGQYGTGFMTSHSFGDVVKVSGVIKDNFEGEECQVQSSGHIKFQNLVIDRSTQDWKKLCDEIRNLRSKVTHLLSQSLTYEELPPTTFKFEFNSDLNKKRAIDAIESLRTILPYVMVFNERLEKVTVTDIYGNTTNYLKKNPEEKLENYFYREVLINDEVKRINYLKSDRLIIVIPIQNVPNDNGYWGTAELLPESLPRLFLFYPLIGTENFGFNFVIHSANFQPTEPRDGLYLNSENEKNKTEEVANQNLIDEASNLIFNFLENNLSRIQNPHLLAGVNFVVNSDDIELSKYFLELKERWTAKYKTLPFVETQTGRISAQEAVFLDSLTMDGAELAALQALYNIASRFYLHIPKFNLISHWSKLTADWNLTAIVPIGFSNIAEKMHEQGTIESVVRTELILLYKEMIRKGQGELFTSKALLPNVKGQLRKQGELSRSVDLTEELLSLAEVINPKISNRQVEKEFLLEGLEFEPFGRRNYMELVNVSLDEHVKDGTRSYSLPNGYLTNLIQYASIASKEDSTSGPLRVIKLIEAHYNLHSSQIILHSLPGEDNIDVRKGQNDLFKIFLNDISDKDDVWVKENIDNLARILIEAFNYADIKKIFLKYDVYPNEIFKLKSIDALHKATNIPAFVKDLYDKVVAPNEPVRTKLVNPAIENIYEEVKSIKSLDLTLQIEQRFFGDSGNEIYMENHSNRPEIIDIIRNFKPGQPQRELYEKIFPATFRNKSVIMTQLADGEDSFAILSQDESRIKKLAGIADHPNLDALIKLGEDALLKKQQDEAELRNKRKLGNHLEDVLQHRLSQNIKANVLSEQDGQDLIVYVEDKPVYYIEVKSKWLETTPIRISRNQTLRAHENPNCFALCSIDMTKYTGADRREVESIDKVIDFMKFNTDVGGRVGHLADIYSNAHQEDKFSLDGDYRTLIPSNYISGGLDLDRFETELLQYINSNYGNQN